MALAPAAPNLMRFVITSLVHLALGACSVVAKGITVQPRLGRIIYAESRLGIKFRLFGTVQCGLRCSLGGLGTFLLRISSHPVPSFLDLLLPSLGMLAVATHSQ